MTIVNPFFLTDGYKTGHHLMYPKGTTRVNSNFTPRSGKHSPFETKGIVSFGQQMVMRYIHECFDKGFFKRDEIDARVRNLKHYSEEEQDAQVQIVKNQVISEIKKEYSLYLNSDYDVSHIESLWDLGYLPIRVKSLPEGVFVPFGVPVLTIENTKDEFYWITNFLETIISNLLWKPMTSATIAQKYKEVLTGYAGITNEGAIGFVDFQGHDFSMRGLDSPFAAMSSGLGHATSFLGSDSLPVIHAARKYYDEPDFVVGSVNATEHSVMCAGTKDDEIGTFRQLMETFPEGILSVVSDTWDLWKVLTDYLPQLKEEILSRNGKLVIRPDSGDPVDILCGESNGLKGTPQDKGVVEILWDVFGGTTNEQGYKVLDEHIGAIYGDSITIQRAEEICRRLKEKGFASTNVVLGVGSYTYQFNTRDTFGFAMKATYCEVNGIPREIFKDPITDDGTKRSAKGLLHVTIGGDLKSYVLVDQVLREAEQNGELIPIYVDGKETFTTTLTAIRNRVKEI